MYRIEFTDPGDPMGMPGTVLAADVPAVLLTLSQLLEWPDADVAHIEIWLER